VSTGKEGLHCRFETPIGDPDLWKIMPLAGVTWRDDATASSRWPKSAAAVLLNNDGTPASGRTKNAYSSHWPDSYNLTRIYTEGCFAGRDQMDPTIDAFDATVDVLNPYRVPAERERWTLGFRDALLRAASYRDR
jgi:hypothetical protein